MHNAACYIEDNLTLPIGKTSLNLSAGLRWENVLIKNSSYDNLRTLSPRLNAKWSLGRHLAIRGGWGITQKLPSFFILYPRQEYLTSRSSERPTGPLDRQPMPIIRYHIQ